MTPPYSLFDGKESSLSFSLRVKKLISLDMSTSSLEENYYVPCKGNISFNLFTSSKKKDSNCSLSLSSIPFFVLVKFFRIANSLVSALKELGAWCYWIFWPI
ncbi:hypothetical protein N9Y89_01620 [bacterium]|nr:hypothetical protein [bacterium]